MKRFFGSIYPAIAWTLLIQIGLCVPVTVLGGEGLLKIPHFDKYVHVILFAGFTALWGYYLFRKGFSTERLKQVFLWVFLAAAAYGILLEFIQLFFVPGRSFDIGDIVADIVGAGLGWLWLSSKILKINPR